LSLVCFFVFKSRTLSPCALICSFSAEALLLLLSEIGAVAAGFVEAATATGLDSFAAACQGDVVIKKTIQA